jgi:hypothetical protein
VTGRIGRFVQIEKSRAYIFGDGTLQWRTALRQRCVVIRANIELVEILAKLQLENEITIAQTFNNNGHSDVSNFASCVLGAT